MGSKWVIITPDIVILLIRNLWPQANKNTKLKSRSISGHHPQVISDHKEWGRPFFEEIAQIFEEPSADNEPSAENMPSGYNDGESPADMAEVEGLLTSDEGSFDASLWDDPSEGSDSSLNYLGANSIAGSVMGTAGVVATRSPARTLLRGRAGRGTHRWLIPGVVLGAGLGYLYKNTQRSQLHASLQGGRASVATPSASSYARASASASEPPSSSQSWIIQVPSPEDPRVADVEPFEATPQEIEFFSVSTALDGADKELSPDVHRGYQEKARRVEFWKILFSPSSNVHRGVQEKVLEELSDAELRVRGLQLQFREKLLKAHGGHLPSKAQDDIARVDSLVRTYLKFSVDMREKPTGVYLHMILLARLVKKSLRLQLSDAHPDYPIIDKRHLSLGLALTRVGGFASYNAEQQNDLAEYSILAVFRGELNPFLIKEIKEIEENRGLNFKGMVPRHHPQVEAKLAAIDTAVAQLKTVPRLADYPTEGNTLAPYYIYFVTTMSESIEGLYADFKRTIVKNTLPKIPESETQLMLVERFDEAFSKLVNMVITFPEVLADTERVIQADLSDADATS